MASFVHICRVRREFRNVLWFPHPERSMAFFVSGRIAWTSLFRNTTTNKNIKEKEEEEKKNLEKNFILFLLLLLNVPLSSFISSSFIWWFWWWYVWSSFCVGGFQRRGRGRGLWEMMCTRSVWWKCFLLCETRVKFSPFYENNQRTLFINERHYY